MAGMEQLVSNTVDSHMEGLGFIPVQCHLSLWP
jgi:hypothetical protein